MLAIHRKKLPAASLPDTTGHQLRPAQKRREIPAALPSGTILLPAGKKYKILLRSI